MPRIAYVGLFALASMLPFIIISASQRTAGPGGRSYYYSSGSYYGRGGWITRSYGSGYDGGIGSYSGGGTRGGK